MKIYCILCDAMPFSEKLSSVAEEKRADFTFQVSNAWTQTSVLSLITGQRPSDILSKGFGWNTGDKKAVANNKQAWYKNNFFHYALHKEDWSVHYHNSTWLYCYLYGDDRIIETSNYPGGLAQEKVSRWDDIHQLVLGSTKESTSFYNGEKKMIDQFQASTEKNSLYFITYQPHHAAIAQAPDRVRAASSHLCDLLSHWNWDEPDSLFIAFADHGDFRHVDKYCTPPHPWLTWAIIKDNINNNKISKKLIEIKDLHSIVAEKILEHLDVSHLRAPQDPQRIYFMEDGRSYVDASRSTTAAAIKAVDWDDDRLPLTFSQLSYHLPENKFVSFLYDRVSDSVSKTNIDIELKKALINNYKWIPDANGK